MATGPSRTPSFDTGTSPQHAALLGATTAFGRLAPKGKAVDGTQGGAHNAVTAVSDLGGRGYTRSPGQRGSRPPSLLRHNTGESVRSVKSNAGGNAPSMSSNPISHLGIPQQPDGEQSSSPSLQAAALAAARAPKTNTLPSTSNTVRPGPKSVRRPAAPPKPRRLSEYSQQAGSEDNNAPTDATSIPPTTSLVDLFERKASVSTTPKQRPGPIVVKPSNDLALKSPKPVRVSSGITSMIQMEVENGQRSPQAPLNNTDLHSFEKPQVSRVLSSTSSYASASEEQPEHEPPSVDTRSVPPPAASSALPNSPASAGPITSDAMAIPNRSVGNGLTHSQTFSSTSASAKSIPAQFHHMYPARRMTPNMSGDQLANAMVAGSLASSRAPSPRKIEPPPPSKLRQKHKSTLGFSRTPSPTKTGMRHTLRKEESESSDETEDESLHPYGKHRKKRLVRKHPNKHHEGDRKRWRDAVTEAERKRYEGLWAANKGLLIGFLAHEEAGFRQAPHSPETREIKLAAREEVSNIVVREIWNRSHLPALVLSDIWQLVDTRGVGRLTKEEFVVGIWLIDQRLKGRKLPPKVGDTVWASVRGLQGIKIKK